ncbi:MAG: glycosyltransferase family 4 protein [Chloroflexi bacterium]|nr:glycosyltransferase family 4 protein [Chloroflexota bacterium]
MHVLFITPSYKPFLGGAQRFVAEMAMRFLRDGHAVRILTTTAREPADFWRPPSTTRPLPAHEIVEGVEVHRLLLRYPWPAPWTFGLLRRLSYTSNRTGLARHLTRWMPPLKGLDEALSKNLCWAEATFVIDASWDGLLYRTASQARRTGAPLVVMPLMHLGDAQVHVHFQLPHQLEIYRQAHALIALTTIEAQAYISLGVDAARLHVVPMGVNPTDANHVEATSAPPHLRDKLGPSRPFALFLGANTEDKGCFTACQAILDLNRTRPTLDLVCAGPQPELVRRYLAAQPTGERALAERHICVLGPVDESAKSAFLAHCEMLLLPSRVDAFGIVLLEAWLHAKPVIGAKAGGIPELVIPGGNGLLVPYGDTAALAQAIAHLHNNPDLRHHLGQAGRKLVLECYTWDKTYRLVSNILKGITRQCASFI